MDKLLKTYFKFDYAQKDFFEKFGLSTLEQLEFKKNLKRFKENLKHPENLSDEEIEFIDDIRNYFMETIDKINNGVDGREYDVIDFYQDKRLGINHFKYFANILLTSSQWMTFIKFYSKNVDIRYKGTQSFIYSDNYFLNNMQISFDCPKNSEGELIKDAGITPTKEEKEAILEFMHTWNIPTNSTFFITTMKRYMYGTLNINKNEGKKKVLVES